MFNRDDSFGEFDLMRRQRLFNKTGKPGKLPPLTGETPPIIAQPDIRQHSAPMQSPMQDMMQANTRPSWREGLGGALSAVGAAMPAEQEESYLEPMPMQQPQGQIQPQAPPPLWEQNMPITPFKKRFGRY